MRGILRWLIIIGLFILVVFLLVNLFNRESKQNKNSNATEPEIYEKSERDIHLFDDSSEQSDVTETPSAITEETIEVGDTADFNIVGVFVGVFLIAGGIYYIRKKSYSL